MRPYLPLLSSLVLVSSLVGCGAMVDVADACDAEGSPEASGDGARGEEGSPSGSCDPAFLAQRCAHLASCKMPGIENDCPAKLLELGASCPARVTAYCLQFTSTEDCSILSDPAFVPVQCSVGL